MSIRNAYTEWAATYDADRNLTRDLDHEVTQAVLGGFRAGAILEIGCGTGKNTPFLAQIGGRVLALDFSPGMIAQARLRLRAAGATNVTLALADLTQPWPCPAASADLIVCNLVLEHIADLAPIFAEARRVMRPRGRLFICELHPCRQYQGKRATFERGPERVEIPAFVHDLSDFLIAAEQNRLALRSLKEWRHVEDRNEAPRLVSFLFESA
jgi:malonyl-CoA O-methyltransferase